jgi:hypothetical protein
MIDSKQTKAKGHFVLKKAIFSLIIPPTQIEIILNVIIHKLFQY